MQMSGERFLIVKTTSMGDVVHALPLASDLARRFPAAAIDWLVEEGFAAIPRMHAAVDRVIPVAVRRWRRAPLSAATWREIRAAKAQLRAQRYSAIVDCQGLLKSAWLARWARGPRWGFDLASAREPLAALLYTNAVAVGRDQHAIARNRALGHAACGTDVVTPASFGLRPPQIAERAWVEATEQPFAVLLTNASRASKRWPADRWRAIERELHARGLRSLLFAGSAGEEQDTRARADGMVDAWVAPRCGIETVAAVLARARIVVGLDTGLSHLAAALGAPTLGIFCDYEPRLVGIAGPAPCASLGGVNKAPDAAAVIAAVDDLLAAAAAAPRLP
jgi:heptosyltransferase-1